MENLFFSLNATIPIFLVMVIGYLLKNLKFVDNSFVKTLNAFNFKITLLALLFRDIAGSDFYEVWDGKYVCFCFLTTLFCILVTYVLASPLALLGLGAGFNGRKALAKMKPTIWCSVAKLVVWPALFLPLAVMLGFHTEKLVAILVMLGSPTTASCYIMAKNMRHEGVLTSSVVVATTFFSSVTLTLWLFLLRSYGAI